MEMISLHADSSQPPAPLVPALLDRVLWRRLTAKQAGVA